MAYAMTKHGSQDNQVVNEFVCDTAADLPLIDKCDVTLGSVAIVLHGDLGLEVYIADSAKEWVAITAAVEEEEEEQEEEQEPVGGGE